jgi:hypothetical protein
MRGQSKPLQDMSEQVWQLAIAVNQMADLIKGLIEELVDLVVTWSIGNVAKEAGAASSQGPGKVPPAGRPLQMVIGVPARRSARPAIRRGCCRRCGRGGGQRAGGPLVPLTRTRRPITARRLAFCR